MLSMAQRRKDEQRDQIQKGKLVDDEEQGRVVRSQHAPSIRTLQTTMAGVSRYTLPRSSVRCTRSDLAGRARAGPPEGRSTRPSRLRGCDAAEAPCGRPQSRCMRIPARYFPWPAENSIARGDQERRRVLSGTAVAVAFADTLQGRIVEEGSLCPRSSSSTRTKQAGARSGVRRGTRCSFGDRRADGQGGRRCRAK